MKLKEITVTYGGKLNLGDYNSSHIEASVTVIADEGESIEEVAAAAFEQTKAAVRVHVREALRKQQVSATEVFQGLPVEVSSSLK
jgi:hypothetical protein